MTENILIVKYRSFLSRLIVDTTFNQKSKKCDDVRKQFIQIIKVEYSQILIALFILILR